MSKLHWITLQNTAAGIFWVRVSRKEYYEYIAQGYIFKYCCRNTFGESVDIKRSTLSIFCSITLQNTVSWLY